jgi:5-(carboxyamino)imidazole ribonucleotide mutase
MPPGIPVATVGVDAGQNAGILAVQILAQADEKIAADMKQFKEDLKEKVLKANEDLKQHKFKNRIN